jgi:RimJ/RimL family protein N-acetyltransferase
MNILEKGLMIKGPRVSLRYVTEEDLPLVCRMAADPDLRGEHLPSMVRSPHEVRKAFAEHGYAGDGLEMLLVVGERGEVIGQVVHFPSRTPAAREIGYLLGRPELAGRGYATEATGLLVNHLFRNRPLNRLEAMVSVRNVASQRVIAKNGFVREGVLRGMAFVGGEYLDLEIHSLLRPEWQARR